MHKSIKWYDGDTPSPSGRMPGRPTDQPFGVIEIISVGQDEHSIEIVYRNSSAR